MTSALAYANRWISGLTTLHYESRIKEVRPTMECDQRKDCFQVCRWRLSYHLRLNGCKLGKGVQ
jgi:hypothetical protein